MWSTSNQNLSRFFQGIINDDLNEVQIMVDKSLETKCHPLCNCDKCDNIENLMTLKEDSNYRTPLMLASWLGKYVCLIEQLKNNSFFYYFIKAKFQNHHC